MEAINLAGLYHLPLLDWALIGTGSAKGLTQAPDTGGPNRHTCWLATINADGSPHVTGVGALWVDGASGSRPAGHPQGPEPRPRPALLPERRDP